METTNDTIKENNYILREIKQIRGKKTILPENIEFIEDYAEIHEIKDIKTKSKQKLGQGNVSNPTLSEVGVRLEGDSQSPNDEINLEGKEEAILENENISNLIENIFTKIEDNDNLDELKEIKASFNSLNENEKNEVIEGIKIKIDNEEQENKFNNLLRFLCEKQ